MPNVNSSVLEENTLSVESLERLKEEVRSCFSEAFYARLEDAERISNAGNSESYARFLDVLIRRLRRLSSLHT